MKKYLLSFVLVIFPVSILFALLAQTQTLSDQQLIHQQERQKALEDSLKLNCPSKIATIIKQQTEGNTLANTVSHAILGAVVAELQGNSANVERSKKVG
ncbi:hypothetical protein A9G39_03785 [Gilliamella sp. Imp1-6]|nr:hypothetical protein A9G39_03785 [Gilliamella apicola]